EAGGRRRDRSRGGTRRRERQRLAAAADGHLPFGRKPLRRQIEVLTADVLESELLELAFDPRFDHVVVLRSRDTAPILVAVVSALAGHSGDLVHVLLHARAVDASIGLFARGQWPAQIVVIVERICVRRDRTSGRRRAAL